MDNRRVLNNMTPGSARAGLGDLNASLIDAHNALVTKFNALLAKLDDDAGVTDTNYEATLAAVEQPGLNDR